jgi:H+/Cl- antiporter ClcA
MNTSKLAKQLLGEAYDPQHLNLKLERGGSDLTHAMDGIVEGMSPSVSSPPPTPFHLRAPLRTRSGYLQIILISLLVGIVCGVFASAYKFALDVCLETVWKEIMPLVLSDTSTQWYAVPRWFAIPLVSSFLGLNVGLFTYMLGEQLPNLPGLVGWFHEHGSLPMEEVPSIAVVSIISIVAGGSLGPEAALVAIGGALASWISSLFDLSKPDRLTITLCGMGAGLAAFFGDPIGGAIFALEVPHRYGIEYYEAFVPAVVAGLACNMVFRVLLNLPQVAIWSFPELEPVPPWRTIVGVPMGLLGGGIGIVYAKVFVFVQSRLPAVKTAEGALRPRVMMMRGLSAGILIGVMGAFVPETLFWAEDETQAIIDGVTELPHVWPKTGILGVRDRQDPGWLMIVGLLKIVAIAVTTLGDFRGGFIFPFMFAGVALGGSISLFLSNYIPAERLPCQALFCLTMAAALNVAATRTVLATPIVLISLSGRADLFPPVLCASVVSLLVNSPFRGVIAKIQPRLGVVSGMPSPNLSIIEPIKILTGRLP